MICHNCGRKRRPWLSCWHCGHANPKSNWFLGLVSDALTRFYLWKQYHFRFFWR